MNTTTETRKYRVIPAGSRGKTVSVTGSFGSDQEWRDEAARVAGVSIDTSFAGERVIRLFPWWLQ